MEAKTKIYIKGRRMWAVYLDENLDEQYIGASRCGTEPFDIMLGSTLAGLRAVAKCVCPPFSQRVNEGSLWGHVMRPKATSSSVPCDAIEVGELTIKDADLWGLGLGIDHAYRIGRYDGSGGKIPAHRGISAEWFARECVRMEDVELTISHLLTGEPDGRQER